MEDKALIKKILNGDRSAIRFLLEKHQNLVWHIIISMTGHKSDAEDLFQEVFLRVFRGLKNFRAESSLSTWVGSITHHVCVDYLRNRKKEAGFLSLDEDLKLAAKLPSDTSWKQAENRDLNTLILTTIAKLPADYRTAITLYHLDEKSYEEIAEITGMPMGTVKSHISRGRDLLRKLLISNVPDLTAILDNF